MLRPSTVAMTFACLLAAPAAVAGQTTWNWITESTITFGRQGASAPNDSFVAKALLLGDIGLRRSGGESRSYGVSLMGGYDVPNEAGLVGVRVRGSEEWRGGRLEIFAGLLASSAGEGAVGGMAGVVYYPWPPFGIVGEVDVLPTTQEGLSRSDPGLSRSPTLSVGVRFAEGAGLVSWLGAAAWGGIAALYAGT